MVLYVGAVVALTGITKVHGTSVDMAQTALCGICGNSGRRTDDASIFKMDWVRLVRLAGLVGQ